MLDRGFFGMDLFSLAQPLAQALGALSTDESSVSVLAMLGGIIGGWTLTSMRQPKPKKVKVERKDDVPPSGR
jgi:hypothetical protein